MTATRAPLEIVLKGIRAVLLGNGSSKFLLVIFELILAKILGATEFGYYAIAIAVMQMASGISVMGISFGVVQHLSIYQEKGDIVKQRSVVFFALVCVAAVSLIFASIIAVGSNFAADKIFTKPDIALVLLCAAPLVFFDALNQAMASAFRGLRQFRNNVFVYDLFKNIFCFVVAPLLLLTGGTASDIMLVCTAGSAVGFAYGMVTLWRQKMLPRMVDLDYAVLPELWNFSKLLFLWGLLQVMAVRTFILVAGVLLTTEETGALAVAMRLALCFIFFQTAVGSTVQAEFARFFLRKDSLGSRDLYQSVTQGLLGVVTIPALILLIDPSFMIAFLGADYAIYGWAVWPLLLAQFTSVVTGPSGQVLVAYERQRLMVGLTLCDIFMQITIVVPLMYFYGVAGAALGEATRIILFVTLRLFIINRILDIHLFGRSYVPLVALFVASLASGLCLRLSGQEYYVAVGYALAFYAVGAGWIIWKDGQMMNEIKMIFSRNKKGA